MQSKARVKTRIRKGDLVQVVTGVGGGRLAPPAESVREGVRGVGRRGKVLEIHPAKGRAVVEGVKEVHKHVKPDPRKGHRGGRIKVEAPIALSNLRLVCTACDKAVRVKGGRDDEGKRVRVCRACGATF